MRPFAMLAAAAVLVTSSPSGSLAEQSVQTTGALYLYWDANQHPFRGHRAKAESPSHKVAFVPCKGPMMIVKVSDLTETGGICDVGNGPMISPESNVVFVAKIDSQGMAAVKVIDSQDTSLVGQEYTIPKARLARSLGADTSGVWATVNKSAFAAAMTGP